MTNTSFQQTISSGSTSVTVSPFYALRYIIKSCPLTTFEISSSNSDGTRKVEETNVPEIKPGKGKKKTVVMGPKSNSSKIQFLLDQRKPPTEKLQSLCTQYDDDLYKLVE
jgi:hypothetical protein